MGWIASVASELKPGLPSIASPIEVEEPAGFMGEWVTPAKQDRDPAWARGKQKMRFARHGETVYRTRAAAMWKSQKILEEMRRPLK